VSFASNNTFRYVDVQNQASWEKSPLIDSYASNLYLLSDWWNQILRHKKVWSDYDAGVAYLTDEDAISTGRILSLAIDGWIYILKLDGSMLKLFRSPKYRLESLVLNKLPKNYDFSSIDSGSIPSLQTKANLKYVYLLLNNRIMVFKPNTIRYQDVKSLEYVWQIEWKDITINTYYVKNDGEIIVSSNSWVYKLGFELSDDKIILK